MKVKVLCTLEVEVETDETDLEVLEFRIEENSCPGTGDVGAVIDRAIDYGDEHGVCWACNLRGSNKILEIDGIPYVRR